MTQTDHRIRDLRGLLLERADSQHARFHKGYHKSELKFHGLKTGPIRAAINKAFPKREQLANQELRTLAEELWASECFEERFAVLELLARNATKMSLRDLAFLKRLTTDCREWALLDHLACNTLGPMAVELAEALYAKVRAWTTHRHMWTRRAAILIHIRPARATQLSDEYAWSSFEELLPETEFFIRKAIGWTLRECSKQYPEEVHDFLARVGDRASGLTRREGARNLPPELRKAILGR